MMLVESMGPQEHDNPLMPSKDLRYVIGRSSSVVFVEHLTEDGAGRQRQVVVEVC